MADDIKLKKEIESFTNLWSGGYFEGDPLAPLGKSSFNLFGYMSVLHATYLLCIKPYVTKDSVVLEIGPGRGAWTKCLLKAKEVWCLDALPAEHNKIYEYLGNPDNVKYFQVSDFKCSMLPDNKFDFFFSFGCFCHISPAGVYEYFYNVFPKLKSGAHAFVLIADYDKCNNLLKDYHKYSFERIFDWKPYLPIKLLVRLIVKVLNIFYPLIFPKYNKAEEMTPAPGRWYHLGTKEACDMLESIGYKVIDPDVGTIHRDPVIHFIKP